MNRAPDRPWEPERTRPVLEGRVVVRLAPGTPTDHLPTARAVSRRERSSAIRVDGGGAIDQVLARFSPAFRARLVHEAESSRDGGRRRWTELEHETGVARVLTVDVDPGASLPSLVDALADLAQVETASPVYLTVTPFSAAAPPVVDPWWAHRMIGAAEALRAEPGDRALVVGVVDSGVAADHPELAGRVRPGIDTVDLPAGQLSRGYVLTGDHAARDRDPSDEMGHGTGCAGILGANGLRLPKGLVGAASLLPARVLAAARGVHGAAVTAIGSGPDIDAGLKHAIDLGAKVLNLSFGTPASSLRPTDPPPHAEIVAYARRRGCVLVAASGNSGGRERYYPSCLDGVIAVGSVGPTGHPSRFTTRGDHVDLCAPGERIPTSGLRGYHLQSGTSFAAPFVTGAAALMCAVFARHATPVDPGLVRDLLMQSARRFPPTADATGCGAGILDVPRALEVLRAELERRFTASRPPAGSPGGGHVP
ncbi:MAG: S8 family serine peptidase [Myxococcota bacterium]